MSPNLLLLGGTVEASALAKRLDENGIPATMSLAGRVANPKPQPIPVRIGGFGGADGLANFLHSESITHVIDATHPFAAQMSANAVAGCASAGVPLVALTRAPWQAQNRDRWTHVPTLEAAAQALQQPARRVLLAIGRMHLDLFAGLPQHHFLLRLVDKPIGPLPFDDYHTIVARGPFSVDNDLALLREHEIDLVISKNAGGHGARSKIDAARELGIEVIMIDRPYIPTRTELHSVDAVMDWLTHQSADRGV